MPNIIVSAKNGDFFCRVWFRPCIDRAVCLGFVLFCFQCCTQGTVFSSLLPAQPSDSTMNPVKIPVPVRKVEDNCR